MGKKPTILAVDDTEINVDILLGILKEFDVIPALSGQEALDVLEEEAVDLILLDIIMPGMDGFEVCRRIKSDRRLKNIPVIFISVKNSEQDIKDCFELGGVDYVAKPFNAVELLARVTTHLELKTYQTRLENKVKEQVALSCSGGLPSLAGDLAGLADLAGSMVKELEKNETVDRKRLRDNCLKIQEAVRSMRQGLEGG
ncbi:MAG: response regulator [Desulfobacterales bacterium]|nr:response regulator [Desulfobacterales bacterium]